MARWDSSTFMFGEATREKPVSHEVMLKMKNKEREEISSLTALYLEKKPITVLPYGMRVDLPKADFKKKN